MSIIAVLRDVGATEKGRGILPTKQVPKISQPLQDHYNILKSPIWRKCRVNGEIGMLLLYRDRIERKRNCRQ